MDFPFPLLSISQYLKFCIYDCTFGLDFPFPLLSISQYFKLCIHDCYFWVGFPVSAVKYFSIFGILHSRLYFWVGFSVSAKRPNGAKILRFGNFPHTPAYPRGVENCQKSKSFSKIWLWKSWTFGYFSDRTRKPPHF